MSKKASILKKTPLHDRHLAAGARIVPFARWSMPLQYTGIIAEHLHTRSKAGLFDICHMGEIFLRGPGAGEEADRLITCRVDDMPSGRCRYGFLLNETGGIIDDLIVFRISPEELMLVVNGACREKDLAWIGAHVSGRVAVTDESDKTAKLDIQGPSSGEVLKKLLPHQKFEDIKRYHFTNTQIDGIRVLLSRTGYTGELGYELFFPAADASRLWDAFLKIDGVNPIGLGARDTLRLEMGYSLYGNDIDETRTPLEANLAKFVFMEKDFIGKEALLKQAKEGVSRLLTAFVCDTRRIARRHFTVLAKGKTVGEVTSGAFSPCLEKGIGLCYIDKDLSDEGTVVTLTDGKTEIEAVIHGIPVYRRA
ncbi:MAG: glycine cleavage system aminomethyltransferase GcvT [Candidatus Omnitrophota bacterium]